MLLMHSLSDVDNFFTNYLSYCVIYVNSCNHDNEDITLLLSVHGVKVHNTNTFYIHNDHVVLTGQRKIICLLQLAYCINKVMIACSKNKLCFATHILPSFILFYGSPLILVYVV